MIKLIIFDYDGVLVDSFPLVYKAYLNVCSHLGKTCPLLVDEFRTMYGTLTMGHVFGRLGIGEADYERAGLFLKKELLLQTPSLFKGIRPVVKSLSHSYSLCLLSSNYYTVVNRVLKAHKLSSLFEEIIAKKDESGGPHFVKTKSIKRILAEHQLSPSEVVLIGDRDVDFREARAAGLSNIILVEYGWGYSRSLSKEGYRFPLKVHRPADLVPALKYFS